MQRTHDRDITTTYAWRVFLLSLFMINAMYIYVTITSRSKQKQSSQSLVADVIACTHYQKLDLKFELPIMLKTKKLPHTQTSVRHSSFKKTVDILFFVINCIAECGNLNMTKYR